MSAGALRPDGPRLPFALSAVLWAYPVLYVLAYIVSGFRVRHGFVQDLRYAMPLLPWLSLAAGVGFEALGRRPGWSARAALGALALVLAVSVAGTLARCDFEGARASWSRPGHADPVLASTIAERYHDRPERLEGIARQLVASRPPEQADAVLFVIGQRFKFYALPRTKLGKRHASKEEYLRTLDRLRASVPPEYPPYFERPRDGERIYRPEERELFWRERG